MKKFTIWIAFLTALKLCAQPGTIDFSFNTAGTGPDTSVYTSVTQPDGKILIAGTFDQYNGVARSGIARLNQDGSLDSSFDPGTGLPLTTNHIYCLALQADGKIMIGGVFANFNGVARNNIARLNANGSVDTSFNPNGGANGEVVTISVQSTGKIIAGGLFTQFNGAARRLVRLNTDGTTDATFAIGTGPNAYIWTSSVLPDDKIYVGGGYSSFNGVSANSIIRLNPDGSRDSSFTNSRFTNNAVLTHALQPDGKIVIGGYFTSYGLTPTTRNRLTRINNDGTLDTSFNTGTGLNDYPLTIVCQSNGKILVGGAFATYNGATANRIVRLNTDGSIDGSFQSGTGMNGILYKAVFHPNGKILLATDATAYNGNTSKPNLVRINGYEDNALSVASLSASAPFCVAQAFNVNYTAQGYFAAGNSFTAQLSNATGSFTNALNIGTLASTNLTGTIPVTLPLGVTNGTGYRIRVMASNLATIGADNGADLAVFATATYYEDADNDGFGNPDVSISACSPPTGYVDNADDCNDAEPAAHTGMTEILYDGIDNNCDGNLDEGNQLTTQLIPASCGATLNAISTVIGIKTIAPAATITGWRVKATQGAEVQILEKTVPHFTMTQFASYAYQTAYTIEIELQRNGIWLGYYGPACTVTTPSVLQTGGAAAINTAQCGQTLAKINTLIATTSIAGVTGYRFKVSNLTDPQGANAVQTIDRGQNWFSLPMLSRYNYGTTYSIEVAIKTNGDFGLYGAACSVSSPMVPTINLCGQTISSNNQLIATTSLSGATMYRFQVTRLQDNAAVTLDRSVNYFTFAAIAPELYTPGGLYAVRVAVMTTGQWSPFGSACNITASGAVSKTTDEILLTDATAFKAYPNPFNSNFTLEGRGAFKATVYDLTGRVIENVADTHTQMVLGSSYPSGVYLIVLRNGSQQQTFKMIKR